MKKQLLFLAATALLAASASAAVIFDGSVGTVYKATSDNAAIALTEPTNGNWVLTSSSATPNHSANIFGNFAATTLSNVGDSITVGFTITGIPASSNTPFVMSLAGSRGAALTSSDVTFTDFQRSYAGFRVSNNINNTGLIYGAWNTGFAPTATGATTITGQDILDGAVTAGGTMGTGSTGGGSNRFDGGDTATVSYSIVRASTTEFRLDYTLNVVGGTGLQSFSSTTLAPTGNFFQLTDAFTTFAIGFSGTMDNGAVINLSNLEVSYTAIPEPSSLALLAGALGGLALLRRRRA